MSSRLSHVPYDMDGEPPPAPSGLVFAVAGHYTKELLDGCFYCPARGIVQRGEGCAAPRTIRRSLRAVPELFVPRLVRVLLLRPPRRVLIEFAPSSYQVDLLGLDDRRFEPELVGKVQEDVDRNADVVAACEDGESVFAAMDSKFSAGLRDEGNMASRSRKQNGSRVSEEISRH